MSKSMATSLTGAVVLVGMVSTSLLAGDVQTPGRTGYGNRSSINVRSQPADASTLPGTLPQQPAVTIRVPGLVAPSGATPPVGTNAAQPGTVPQLPSLPTPASPSVGSVIPGQSPVTSAINPSMARPVPPTTGVPIVPSPTSSASLRPAGATTVISPGAGYNAGATRAYGSVPTTTGYPVSPTAFRGPLGPTAVPSQPPAGHAPAAIQPYVPPAPTAIAEKPFSGFTPPPAYSPYMNLFRNDNNRGRINNYYSLVRPMQEQQQVNSQTQYKLQSLQSTTRAQGSQLQEIDQRTQPPVPASTNPSFMNYQHYYPGLAR